jgi:predicted amidophosphoribosyltransferase
MSYTPAKEETQMPRPRNCPNCGRSCSQHTGTYCQECGEPLVLPVSVAFYTEVHESSSELAQAELDAEASPEDYS